MAVWLVRAGKGGELEDYALERGVAVIGWTEAGDLSNISTREGLLTRLVESYPEAKHKTLLNWQSQIWPFRDVMKPGDTVALPLKHRPAVAFGRVLGPYQYVADAPYGAHNQIPVEWLKEVPRASMSQDLLYSLGAFMTVCRISKNDAETRIAALIAGSPDPVAVGQASSSVPDADGVTVDLESVVRDQIRATLYAKFKGHGLARLVGALLEAQGYRTVVSPEGPDGGVDVVAGTGPLGFGSPRLVAQVKSDQAPIDVKVVRELQGVMKQFGAEHGLVVAWGGFKSTVIKEVARQYFEIRLWTGDDLVENVLERYDSLPADIRAELPLKRIWSLALVEDE